VSRLNPETDWVVQDVPELRIIDHEIWEAAKARQKTLALTLAELGENALTERRRPKHLLAGLAKCGRCGGGYTMISKELLGCAAARNKGTCDNRLNIRRDAFEASVLSGLRSHLMEPQLFKEFCEEFAREVNRLRIERADQDACRNERDRIDRELAKLLTAIKAGGPIPAIVAEMKRLETRKTELADRLAIAEEPPPLLHPHMAEIYRQRISTLYESLQDQRAKAEAAEIFRSLIDQVMLVPDKDDLAIVLRGDLAAMLSFAAGKRKPGFLPEAGLLGDLVSPVSVVAGVGFEPTTFRL
jgi:site-specific DNA recombinase